MAIHLLSEDQAMTAVNGRYNDGGGLWLIVRNHGRAASYFFEYNGELIGEQGWQHVSLGARKKISLRQARDRAEFCRQLIKNGSNSPKYWRQHERKNLQLQQAANLTVAEAVARFREFGTERLWHSKSARDQVRGVVENYFQPSPIWKMRAQDVESTHAAKLLDPIWFPKPEMATRVQTFGHQVFKWLKLNKLHFEQNPFDGSKYSPLVQLLGGPQPPGGHIKEPELDDVPLIMAHLRKPPGHADDVCTVAEAAEATGRKSESILKAIKHGLFPGAYKWAEWATATYLIPVKELVAVFPLRQPLRHHIDIPLESIALQYTLLTVVRSGMTCNLRWDYIKERRGVIEYPDHKTSAKTNDVYTVILTPAVAEVLEAARAYQKEHDVDDGGYVFVKGESRTGIDVHKDERVKKAALWSHFKLHLARIPGIETVDASLHGIRTTFVTWAVDKHGYLPQEADAVLGHVIKGITNKAYFRNVKYFSQIQKIMIRWGEFIQQVEPESIDVIRQRSQPQLLNMKGKRYA